MWLFAIAILIVIPHVWSAAAPFFVNTSSNVYGPDGPWYAISIQLGSPPQNLDIYPAGIYESIILSKQVCSTFTSTLCGAGGLFDPSVSSTYDNSSIAFGQDATSGDVAASGGAIRYATLRSDVTDTLSMPAASLRGAVTAPGLSISLCSSFNMTYPGGTVYPAQLGYLSLGPHANQSFGQVNASIVPGILTQQGDIGSDAWGLHVGSAAFKLPLSLWLGGFDAWRLTGAVSTQQVSKDYSLEIDLFDIGIGVESGGSPFPYSSRQGILADGNSSIHGSIPVLMNAGAPYLSLPNSTCASITRDLPVTYQAKYGLYFWDTTDPRYMKIVTSPSFLSFTFRASGSSPSTNLTINVPFSLLNLTLDEPLISTPTPYFPCQPPQLGDEFSLGRAFLQAAFIGVNWGMQTQGEWYLAQAPGPGVASTPSQVPFAGTVNSPPSNDWAGTWQDHWTPLPNASSMTASSGVATNSPAPISTGLSSGAKAGIGIGVAVVVLVLIGAALLFIRNRRNNQLQSAESSQQAGFLDPKGVNSPDMTHEEEQVPSQGSYKPEKESGYETGQQPEIYEAPGQDAAELAPGEPLSHELSSMNSTRNPSRH